MATKFSMNGLIAWFTLRTVTQPYQVCESTTPTVLPTNMSLFFKALVPFSRQWYTFSLVSHRKRARLNFSSSTSIRNISFVNYGRAYLRLSIPSITLILNSSSFFASHRPLPFLHHLPSAQNILLSDWTSQIYQKWIIGRILSFSHLPI